MHKISRYFFPACSLKNMFVLWSLVSVFSLKCALAIDPWLILIEGEHTPSGRKYAGEVVRGFAAAEHVDTKSKQRLRRIAEGLASPWYFDLASGDDDSPLTGWMYVATPTTLSQRFRFWHSDDVSHYDRLTTIVMSERDGNVGILENKFERVVGTGQKQIQQDKVLSSWADLYLGQRDGLITLGSTSGESIVMGSVAAIVDQNMSRSYFFRFQPSAIPDPQKAMLISEIVRQAGIHMQQRDQESDLHYHLRFAKGDFVLQACKSALYDVDFIEGYTAWPDSLNEEKFRFGMTIVAKEKTALATIIDGLAARGPSVKVSPAKNGIGTCVIKLRFPDESSRFVESTAKLLAEALPSLEPICSAIRETGELLCAMQFSQSDDSEYTLIGICGSPYSVTESAGRENTDPDSSALIENRGRMIAYGPFSADFLGTEFAGLRVLGLPTTQRVEFTVTKKEASPGRLTRLTLEEASSGSDLCSVSVNFAPKRNILNDEKSNPAQSIRQIEELLHSAILEYRLGKKLRSHGVMKISKSGFSPLAPPIDNGSDYSLDLNISARGRTLRVYGTMGRDLHALVLARTVLTESLLLDLEFIQGLLSKN